MKLPDQARRCAVLLLEPRARASLDLAGLFGGGSALCQTRHWVALAPHLDAEVELDAAQAMVLGALDESAWTSWAELEARHPCESLAYLLEHGLLIGDHAGHVAWRERDDTLRTTHWRPLAAVAHCFSRWSGVGRGEDVRRTRNRPLHELVTDFGAPPPHQRERGAAEQRVRLPVPRRSGIDELLDRRVTCRNFERMRPLSSQVLSDVLHRVLGARAEVEVVPGVHAYKKSHPSGGSLHPFEGYLIVRAVEGLAPGLYHYHAGQHALQPLEPCSPDAARALAVRAVAGQEFFADAAVALVLAPRFGRTFWKYRNHPKAYRAIVLEAGHISQNLYLAATEAGLGAYITAAINEVEIEQAFGLDPMQEGPIAVCGFGWRSEERTMVEFDPLGRVWPAEI